MNKFILTFLFYFIAKIFTLGQFNKQNIFTQDIDNFWVAFDSVQSTKDSIQKIQFIQKLYVDKGSVGLKAFINARNYSPEHWVKIINNYPKFWNSIRSNTLQIKSKAVEINKSIIKLKKMYPDLRNAKMYFTIGGLNSGGTTQDSMVLIGAEIATGNMNTDVSEFSNNWLAEVFKEHTEFNFNRLNIHEYIHTQQNGEPNNIMAQAIAEGSCDFITEIVLGKQLQTNFIQYGLKHETELKKLFKEEMFSTAYNNWFYQGSNEKTVADLGYFMGYQICKSYYSNSKDKKKAIKDIIELNYSDTNAIENFLKISAYYKENINKEQIIKAFQAKQPYFIKMLPFNNGDSLVDTTINQITLVFSKPMNPKRYSINYGEKGEESFPIIDVIGYSINNTAMDIKVKLKPNHEYNFIISNNGFISEDGYPLLKDYEIIFKTKR